MPRCCSPPTVPTSPPADAELQGLAGCPSGCFGGYPGLLADAAAAVLPLLRNLGTTPAPGRSAKNRVFREAHRKQRPASAWGAGNGIHQPRLGLGFSPSLEPWIRSEAACSANSWGSPRGGRGHAQGEPGRSHISLDGLAAGGHRGPGAGVSQRTATTGWPRRRWFRPDLRSPHCCRRAPDGSDAAPAGFRRHRPVAGRAWRCRRCPPADCH